MTPAEREERLDAVCAKAPFPVNVWTAEEIAPDEIRAHFAVLLAEDADAIWHHRRTHRARARTTAIQTRLKRAGLITYNRDTRRWVAVPVEEPTEAPSQPGGPT